MKIFLKALIIGLLLGSSWSLKAQLKFEKDFNKSPAKQNISEWTEINGVMYFGANDGYFGNELWKFDPNTEKATRLTDLRPKGGSSEPKDMILYDDKIYFFAYADDFYYQLYYYDQAANKIKIATDFLFDDYRSGETVVYNNKLWFTGKYEGRSNLWNYDASTKKFTEISSPLEAHGNSFSPAEKIEHKYRIYFQGMSREDKYVLWSYDDFAKTFEQERTQYDDGDDIWIIKKFVTCNEKLIFRMRLEYQEHWTVYNETKDSIQTINSDYGVFNDSYACYNESFIFSDNGLKGLTLYDTQTEEINYLLDEINDFPAWGKNPKLIDSLVYFNARYDNSYNNVFSYDPGNKNLELLPVFESVEEDIYSFVKNGADIYAFADDGSEREIFKFNTKESSGKMIADINKANRGGFPINIYSVFHEYDERFYFNTFDSNFQIINFWAKDVDGGNFYDMSQILNGKDRPILHYATSINRKDRMFFSGAQSDDGLQQLVSYKNGADSLTRHLNIPHVPLSYNPYFQGLLNYGDNLIFSATKDYEYFNQLFIYNPDTDELNLPLESVGIGGTPNFIMNDNLYFTGTDTAHLWDYGHYSLDLLNGDLMEIANDSLLNGTPNQVFKLGDKIAYGFIEPVNRNLLIQIFDPSNEERKNILPEGYDRIDISQIGSFDKEFIFYDYQHDQIIFTIDSETDSCLVFLDLTNQDISIKGGMIEYDNKLYFEGYTFESGNEVFEYDPNTGITKLYGDINKGSGNSYPEDFKVIGDRLYFTADDGFRGHELWSLTNCFEASLEIVPDSLGISMGQITVVIEGGQAPYSYKWNTGDADKQISGLSSGFYEVQIKDANGCEASVFTILEGGLISAASKNVFIEGLKIYPNPVTDRLLFEGLEEFKNLKISFYNLNGSLVKQEYANNGIKEISVFDLSEGLYFLLIEIDGNFVSTHKVLVNR